MDAQFAPSAVPIHRPESPATEQRRIDREEGQRLVFAGAQDFARREGKIRVGRNASYDTSVIGRGGYSLRSADGALIMRVPLAQARDMLRFRRALARRLLKGMTEEVLHESTADVEQRQIRLQPEHLRALAWAIGTGRRFPYQEGLWKHRLISVALLPFFVLPGVAYYLWRVRAPRQRYKADLRLLLQRWHEQGRPDPPASFFKLYDL